MTTLTSADYWRAAGHVLDILTSTPERSRRALDYHHGVLDADRELGYPAALDRLCRDALEAVQVVALDARELVSLRRELMEAAA